MITDILKHARLQLTNLLPDETRAIGDLKKEDSIIIVLADKDKAILLMDHSVYNEKSVLCSQTPIASGVNPLSSGDKAQLLMSLL